MKKIKIITYSLDLALLNKYFELFIHKKSNKTSTFTFQILGFRHFMMISKYLFDRAKSRL